MAKRDDFKRLLDDGQKIKARYHQIQERIKKLEAARDKVCIQLNNTRCGLRALSSCETQVKMFCAVTFAYKLKKPRRR